MSESHLPDDYRQWPQNPYELLGVEPGVSDRDLKRAYTRLIRAYKPEHAPEQFRLIREAYEALQNRGEYDWLSASLGAHSASEGDQQANESTESAQTKLSLESIWNRAIEGQVVEAYQEFLEKRRVQPELATLYLRLYWLLNLDRTLDPDREPCEWLCDGLMQCDFSEDILSTYLTELKHRNKEALQPRCIRLLQANPPTHLMMRFISAYWEALLHLQEWEQIQQDYALIKRKIAMDDESSWLNLIGRLREWLTWKNVLMATFLKKQIAEDIEAHQAQNLRQSYWFERYDMMMEAISNLDRLCYDANHSKRADQVREFVQKAWLNGDEAKPEDIVDFADELADNPTIWLNFLDVLACNGDYILVYINNIFQYYDWSIQDQQQDRNYLCGRFDSLARAFQSTFIQDPTEGVITKIDEHYMEIRTTLVRFCCDEIAPPDELLRIYSQEERPTPELLFQANRDIALLIVSKAVRILRY